MKIIFMAMAVSIFVHTNGMETVESSDDIILTEFGIKIENFGKDASEDIQLPNISSIVDEN